MIIDEYFGNQKIWWDSQILATDISNKVLNKAVHGVYSNAALESLPSLWKLNYLNKIDKDKYEFKDNIKKEVIFRKFNLMEEIFPFKNKFHVIFCRNVMIYFDEQTKIGPINKFYDSLELGILIHWTLQNPLLETRQISIYSTSYLQKDIAKSGILNTLYHYHALLMSYIFLAIILILADAILFISFLITSIY